MPPSLSFPRFRDKVARGEIAAVYLLEGEELHLHEEAILLLERACVPEASAGFDRESLRGEETTLGAVLDLASIYPMGDGRRLVLVRGAESLPTEPPARLQAYLAHPNEKSCLVLSGGRFDQRRSIYKALSQGAVRVDCAPLDEARTALWVRERLHGRGYGIAPELAEAIAAGLSGDGLGRLDAELEKLMSSIGAPRPVEADDLKILSNVPRVGDAFLLARQVVGGARGEAIASVRALLQAGEDPLLLLGGMAWYFRTALKARVAGDRRVPPRELQALYAVHPGRIDRFRREIGSATIGQLRRALRLCLRADRELKGMGAKDPAHALERVVHESSRREGRP